jgi:hypothetical protein
MPLRATLRRGTGSGIAADTPMLLLCVRRAQQVKRFGVFDTGSIHTRRLRSTHYEWGDLCAIARDRHDAHHSKRASDRRNLRRVMHGIRLPSSPCGGDGYGKKSAIRLGSTRQFVSNTVLLRIEMLTMPLPHTIDH